jgi:hypothetical protein
MNNNQLFDDHIKEQFSNYSPDVLPHIWDAIVAKKKDRRPGFLFSLLNRKNLLILLGILLAGGSGAWLLNNAVSSSADEKTLAGTTIDKNQNPNNNTTAATMPSTTVAAPVINDAVKNQNPNNNTTTATMPSTTVTAPITNDAVTSTDKNYPSSIAIDKTSATTDDPSSFIKKKNLSRSSRTSIKTYSATPYSNGNDDPSSFAKNNVPLKTAAATQVEVMNEEEDNDDAPAINKLPVGGTLLGRLTYSIPEKGMKPTDKTALNKRNTPDAVLPKCPVEKNISGNKKYFEVYGSYDYGLRSLKDSGNSSYLQKRKESTTFSSAYSAGIRYTRVFNNSMSVRGGINFSQINEKFTLVQGNVIQIVYIINASGDTTGSYTTTGTRYKTTHNKYRTIDVPLLIGYEMGNGRLHTNINAGPVINIYSWQRGEVLDATGQPVSITTGKSNTPYGFKTNAGIGFMGAISIYYKLTENLHLLAEPYFRYNFNQMNKENITFKQKYNTLGFRLGLRLDIP